MGAGAKKRATKVGSQPSFSEKSEKMDE
jgi:hypothetical protein